MYIRRIFYHLSFKFKEELKHLYIFNFLKFVLLVVFSNFTLFYIYSFGVDKLLFYMFVFYFFSSSSIFLFKYFTRFFSVEQLFTFSFMLRIITLFLLFYIDPSNYVHLFFPAFLQGIANSLEWLPTHYLLAFKSDRKNISEERALVDMINYTTKVIAPFLFGLLIDFVGFRNFYIIVSFFILLLAFYLSVHYKKFQKETIIHLEKDKGDKNIDMRVLFFIIYDFSLFVLFFIYILSLFNFFVNRDVSSFGFFLSLSNLVLIFLALLISKRLDKFKDYSLAVLGLFLGVESFILLNFFDDILVKIVAIFLFPIALILIEIPYSTAFYVFLRKTTSETFLFHQFLINFLRSLFLLFLLLKGFDISSLFITSLFFINLVAFVYYFFIRNFEIEEETNELIEKKFIKVREIKNKEILKKLSKN